MEEDRIASLEKEMLETRQAVATMRDFMLYTAGKNRILEGAVFALIEAYPEPDVIREILGKHLGPIEANIVSASESEDQVKGAQELVSALRSAIRNPA